MIAKYFEVICEACGTIFVIPKELHEGAMKSSAIPFFCPYGHKLRFDEETREKELKDKLNETSKPNLRLVIDNDTK